MNDRSIAMLNICGFWNYPLRELSSSQLFMCFSIVSYLFRFSSRLNFGLLLVLSFRCTSLRDSYCWAWLPGNMVWIYSIVHRRCRKCKPFTSSFDPMSPLHSQSVRIPTVIWVGIPARSCSSSVHKPFSLFVFFRLILFLLSERICR